MAGRFVDRRVASGGACAGAGQQVTTKVNGLSCFALSLAGPSVRVVPAASRTHSPFVSLVVPVVPDDACVPVVPDDASVPFMPSDRASNSAPLTARSSRWQPDTTLRPCGSGSECVRGSSPAACSFSARPRHMKPPSATSLMRTPAESLTVEVSANMGSMWHQGCDPGKSDFGSAPTSWGRRSACTFGQVTAGVTISGQLQPQPRAAEAAEAARHAG